MLSGIGKTHQKVGKVKRRLSVAPSGQSANPFLALPTISDRVPVHSVAVDDDKSWLAVAKLCSDLVSDDELEISDATTARDIVSQALSAWASKHCQNIAVLDSFSLEAALDRDVFCLDFPEDLSTTPAWFVGVRSEQLTPYINVKNKIDALENVCPGLGRTAIEYAERAGHRTFSLFSPSMGFYHAQNIYWCGCDNDADVIMECGYEEEDEILLPSQYESSFPEMYLKGESLSREALQGIAASDTEASETASMILSIMDLVDQDARFDEIHSFYGESAYFSAYMGLNEENNTMFDRVLDDFYQYTSQDESITDIYGIATLPFDQSSFRQWRDKMEKGFLLYQKLDQLMQLIGEVRQ